MFRWSTKGRLHGGWGSIFQCKAWALKGTLKVALRVELSWIMAFMMCPLLYFSHTDTPLLRVLEQKTQQCHAVTYGRHLVRHGDSIPLMLTSPSRDLPPCLEALGSLVPWKCVLTPMLRWHGHGGLSPWSQATEWRRNWSLEPGRSVMSSNHATQILIPIGTQKSRQLLGKTKNKSNC